MKSLLLAACFATVLSARPDIYVSLADQVNEFTRAASVISSLKGRPTTVPQAAARYRRLAQYYQRLDAALLKLDRALLELKSSIPISPMDVRMRQLRRELAERLRQAHGQSDEPETARLLHLIHLADMEIAEAAQRLDQDTRDPRLSAKVLALRRLEVRVRQNQRAATAAAEVLEHWGRELQ